MTTLLIDDDPTLRRMLAQAFELEDLPVDVFEDPHELLHRIGPGFDGVVVSDVRMPGMDGMELFGRIKAIDADIPVLLMTGHADIPMVIAALKDGVFDFIPKPFSTDHLIASVRKATERRALVIENRRLRDLVARGDDEVLIGETPVMVRLRDTIRQVAQADVDVLIEGETGSGKELVARLLHRGSTRRARPFVAVNCAALPPGMAEAELLGHAPGVLTQFRSGQPGRIRSSDKGTLMLDEIGSLPAEVQGALLRVLEEREVQSLGEDRPVGVDLRVISATNVDLGKAVASGAFRKDLFYRLNQIQLRIPPLRERMADVPLLFAHFVAEAAAGMGREPPPLDRSAIGFLSGHEWPGNVRELRAYARRFMLGVHDPRPDPSGAADLATQVAAFERGVIRRVMEETAGDIPATQARLGLARNTLYDKLKRYGLKSSDFR